MKEGAEQLDKTLREQPWMEGFLRAMGVNPRTGPMPPLSPAEKRCQSIMQNMQNSTPDMADRDIERCKAGLRAEWMQTH